MTPKLWIKKEEIPADFSPTWETAAVFLEAEGKILIMQRHPDKPYGLKWGLPGGKLEAGETIQQAAAREIQEELGLTFEPHHYLPIGNLHIRLPECDFIFHMFSLGFPSIPSIQNDPLSHIDWKWTTVDEARKLPGLFGATEAFDIYQSFCQKRQSS